MRQTTELNRLRIPTGRRQTSWLCISTAEELNQGLPRTNRASGQSGTWTRDLRISSPATLPPRWSLLTFTNNGIKIWISYIFHICYICSCAVSDSLPIAFSELLKRFNFTDCWVTPPSFEKNIALFSRSLRCSRFLVCIYERAIGSFICHSYVWADSMQKKLLKNKQTNNRKMITFWKVSKMSVLQSL